MGESFKVFYGNLCFVCHLTAKEKTLKKCGSCKLVSYCSEAHQRIHWKSHRALCRIIQKECSLLKPEYVGDDTSWYKYRTNLLFLCELKLGRKLERHESNMILFPNNCRVCHKESNLQVCFNCLCINYCSETHKEADFESHKGICHLFALNRELELYLHQNGYYPKYSFRKENFCLLDSMNEFIETNLKIEEIKTLKSTQKRALISELITCPLSMLFALSYAKYLFPNNLIIHVVGCGNVETASLKSWGTILHIIPNIQRLEIHFIGPELQKNDFVTLCSLCDEKISFIYSTDLYHNYSKMSNFKTPDIICCFNCGFHEFENSHKDTWAPTLPLLIQNQKIPLIFTSFTRSEAERDANILNNLNKKLNVNILKNKFSGLRPYRDVENLGVFFSNDVVCLVYKNC